MAVSQAAPEATRVRGHIRPMVASKPPLHQPSISPYRGVPPDSPLPRAGNRSRVTTGGCTPTGGAPKRRRRFSERQKWYPVLFVACTIPLLWAIYSFCHCAPMLQLGPWRRPWGEPDLVMQRRGAIQCGIFQFVTALLVVCYIRSIITHPGPIPEDKAEWDYVPQDGRCPSDWFPMMVQETKKNGLPRHCKWCVKYKPDRAHHCRVCRTCILKMDHHCPWLYNCVGFHNYKFFFLLLLYSTLDCHLIFWTMMESVGRCANNPDTPFLRMFLTLFGVTLSCFLGILGTAFFGFHIFLTLKAKTCIELLEKSQPGKVFDQSPYDVGVWGNIRAILGEVPLLWLLPLAPPKGEGLSFVSEETRLTADSTCGSGGIRRRNHQTMQRPHFGIPYGMASMMTQNLGNFSQQVAMRQPNTQPISAGGHGNGGSASPSMPS